MEMMVTLTQVFMYEHFVHQGKTPLFFCASGQDTSRTPTECGWVTGSRDCFTGDTACGVAM